MYPVVAPAMNILIILHLLHVFSQNCVYRLDKLDFSIAKLIHTLDEICVCTLAS